MADRTGAGPSIRAAEGHTDAVSWDEINFSLPSNLDDEDLPVDSTELPVPSPIATATRTSFQLLLARML